MACFSIALFVARDHAEALLYLLSLSHNSIYIVSPAMHFLLHFSLVAIAEVQPIRFFKAPFDSRSKLHISIGYHTVMATVSFFCSPSGVYSVFIRHFSCALASIYLYARGLHLKFVYLSISINIYMCVCVCRHLLCNLLIPKFYSLSHFFGGP